MPWSEVDIRSLVLGEALARGCIQQKSWAGDKGMQGGESSNAWDNLGALSVDRARKRVKLNGSRWRTGGQVVTEVVSVIWPLPSRSY